MSAKAGESYAYQKDHDESSRRGRGGMTVEYRAWSCMLTRCYQPNFVHYGNYGGRGITVCAEWRASYAAFLAHVGRRPSPEHSLDRIDSRGNYEPGNCRWATRKEQARNTRRNRLVTIAGETLPIAAWAERYGVPRARISARLRAGWADEPAVLRPAGPQVRHAFNKNLAGAAGQGSR